MALNSLPRELLIQIAWFVDVPSLKNLRLASKAFQDIAAIPLFERVAWFPVAESLAKARSVMNHEVFRSNVRKVLIHPCPVLYNPYDCKLPTGNFVGEFKALEGLIGKLGDFPSLRAVVLHLEHGLGQQGYLSIENPPIKVAPFFQALADFNPPLREVAIKNISASGEGLPLTKPIRRLQCLRLHTSRPGRIYSSFAYEASYIPVASHPAHEFFNGLPLAWLRPSMSTMRHLTLYHDCYFGYFPKLDLRGIRFPQLQTLVLGSYTFAQDWQLDWILSHGSTLKKLYMEDCPIIYQAVIYTSVEEGHYVHLREEGQAANLLSHPLGENSWSYQTRWHDYLDAFRFGLPQLKQFAFRYRCWLEPDDCWTFEKDWARKNSMHKDMYMAFDHRSDGNPRYGHEATSVDDGNSDLKSRIGERPQCEKEDKQALEALFKVIETRNLI